VITLLARWRHEVSLVPLAGNGVENRARLAGAVDGFGLFFKVLFLALR
jgi:hypothetical protein